MSKHLLPLLRKQKGSQVANIASMAGKRAVPKLFGYSASKFGMVALTQCLAKENEDCELYAVTICPGGMNTEMRAQLFGKEDAARQQSTETVAAMILDVLEGKIKVESGGDIVIRYGEITAVNPCPGA